MFYSTSQNIGARGYLLNLRTYDHASYLLKFRTYDHARPCFNDSPCMQIMRKWILELLIFKVRLASAFLSVATNNSNRELKSPQNLKKKNTSKTLIILLSGAPVHLSTSLTGDMS